MPLSYTLTVKAGSGSFLPAPQLQRRRETMNQPEMREEYDFSNGERAKYAEAAKAGSNIIRLDPDVAAVLHDAKQVNDLLRSIANLIQRQA